MDDSRAALIPGRVLQVQRRIRLAPMGLVLGASLVVAGAPGHASAAPVPGQGGHLARPVATFSTTTTVASSANPSIHGQSVTFTATVLDSGATAPPGGTVDFTVGPFSFTGVAINGSGEASVSVSTLAAGSHTVSATYGGFTNGTDTWLASSGSLAGGQTVDEAPTKTTVVSSANPVPAGTAVTFTATVAKDEAAAGVALPGAGTPAGTVTFKANGAVVGTGTLSGGVATATVTLCVGTYEVTAEYDGSDANFLASTGTLTPAQTVSKGPTTLVLTSSAAATVSGESVTFTATISPAGGACAPAGQVTFKANGVVVDTAPLSVAGVATIATTSLLPGSYTIVAEYEGDDNFLPSTSNTVAHTVGKASTSLALSRSTNVPFPAHPSKYGQLVTFTATLTAVAPGAGTPTGFALFKADGATFAVGFLDGAGVASATTGALAVGSHIITVVYGGDARFDGVTSAALTQTVEKAATTTTIETIATPAGACGAAGADMDSCWGQPVIISATVRVDVPGVGIPTGSVTFKDGSAALATVPLDLDGVAQMGTDAFEVATHSITAEFSGSVNQMPGTSPTWSHRVWKAGTTTAVTSVPASSPVYGESFQVSAKVSVVAPGAGSPTGNVRFTFAGPVTKSYDVFVSGDGTAAFTYTPVDQTDPSAPPALVPGTYTVTAAYLGDSHFNPSTSGASSVTVLKSPVTITLSPSVNPSVFGQLVAFSVIVSPEAPGSGTPSGSVTFKADGSPMACSNGPNPATLDSQSRARCDFSALTVGSHTIAAEYGGDATFNPKTESLTQVVDKTPTATTLTSSVNPSVFGQSVTFDAHVAILSPGSGIPTGDVVFKDNGTPVLTATLDGAGDASYTTTALSVGSHTMTAEYQGTADIEVSTVDLVQQVNKADTTTTLAPPDGTSFSVGSTATFVATITVDAPGGGTVAGTVAFQRAGIDITGCGSVPVAAGSATCATSALPVGTHPIRAVYGGSASHATSQSPTQFYEVLGAASATTLTSSANPSVFGQPVTFDATVTGGVGTPTGEVIFKADGINIGTAPLVAGVASFTTASLAVGTHAMTALYTGDSTYSQSISAPVSQVVAQATTATALSSSVNPSVFGQQVTFTASVTVVAPGAGTPTGTVTFKEGATTLGVGFVGAGGTAEFSTAALAVGSHPVTATYDGDASFAASTSAPVTQVVNPAATTTTVTGAPNPSFIGDPVTFVATVAAVAPGGGVPAGAVSFTADASPIAGCTALALDAFGEATCTTSSLALGSHNIVAAYGGSTDHGASTSPVLVQVVSDTPVDLGVVSVGRPNPVKAGDMLTITITATNHSLVTGVSATLTDVLPPQVEFSSLTPAAGWTCTTPPVGSSGTVSCTGFLPAASDAVFTVVVDVPLALPAGTLLTNTATIAGAQPDLNPANNTSVDETTVFRTRR